MKQASHIESQSVALSQKTRREQDRKGKTREPVDSNIEGRTRRIKEEAREEAIPRELETMSDSEAEDYGMGEALPEAGIEGRRVMPLRHDKGSLSYAGGPVGRYLRDVEDLVKRCGGGDDNKLYYAAYYCDDRHEKLFAGIYRRLKVGDKSWRGFKKAALAQLEGSDGRGRLYTLEMAKELVARRREKGITGKADIVDYQREFLACANELIAAEITSEGEMGRLFEEGLPEKLKNDLKLRLEFKFPHHKPGRPYKLEELVNTLLYLADTGIALGGERRQNRANDVRQLGG